MASNSLTFSIIRPVGITSTTHRHEPPTSPLQTLTRFNFSCKTLYSIWYDLLDPQLLCIDDSKPPEARSTALGLRQLLNRSEARRFLNRLLRDWFPFLRNWRRLWVDQVLERAMADVGSMPRSHDTVVVDFHVAVHHGELRYEGVGLNAQHAFLRYEGVGPPVEFRVINEGVGPDVGGGDNFMVPTRESWIQSVVENKIVLMDSSETCTVCLEDFSDVGGEGVLMPCGHVFHRDCIREWLRTSHYCPFCRFQLPTD